MAITAKTGATTFLRGKPLAVLMACSSLAIPVGAEAQSVFPPRDRTAAITQNPGADPVLPGPSTPPGAIRATEDPAAANLADPPLTGMGAVPPAEEQPFEEDLNQPYEQPLNPPEEGIEGGGEAQPVSNDPDGIRLGSFRLRPSINQSVNTEITRSGGAEDRRNYFATAIRGTLTSDWSRHALTVTGQGTFERDIGGDRQFEPEGRIDSDLQLDLSNDTTAHILGGYGFEREDNTDPNAIGNAATQSGVHRFDGGLSVERDFGVIRGEAALGVSRSIYTDAELRDGTKVSLSDRDRTGIDGRLRLGYELSTALIPFVEVATGHTFYDQTRDNAGYARSSQSYAARGGVEFDLGEKMRGEIGAGYQTVHYDDSRLSSLDAVTFDGNLIWSPQRGTDVNLGLRTAMQDSTTPGQGGWVEYQLTAEVTHQLRNDLVARLSGSTTLRDFPDGLSSETAWTAGAGLTWNINRFLELTGDVEFERNEHNGRDHDDIIRAGIGLTLRR